MVATSPPVIDCTPTPEILAPPKTLVTFALVTSVTSTPLAISLTSLVTPPPDIAAATAVILDFAETASVACDNVLLFDCLPKVG